MSFHSLPDDIINIQESDLSMQEFLYCKLICCIEYRRHGSALSGSPDRHRKSQECLHIRLFKSYLAKLRKIKAVAGKISSVRIIECILDWKAHIRCSKLSNDATILKLHHGMDHTLRLNHHLNMIKIHPKKPFGFHDLKAFIYQSRGIYRDLLSHYPVRMLQCILKSHLFKIISISSTERTAGCRDQKFMYFFAVFSIQSLKDRTVLTVNRKDLYSVFLCHRHDQMSCSYQGFFVCQGNILTRTDRLDRRTDTKHSYDCCYKDFCFRHGSQFKKSIHP